MQRAKYPRAAFVVVAVAFTVFAAGAVQALPVAPPNLSVKCDSLFHLVAGTQADANLYLNDETCGVYEDLLDRYANCPRIQLDGISCNNAITQLNPTYAKQLDAMLSAMSGAGYNVSIISATRNRPLKNLVGSTALSSNHLYGCAADIIAPGWSSADRSCASTACRAAQRFAAQAGLRSLGYYPEFNHFQPSGTALAVCRSEGKAPGASPNVLSTTLASAMPSFSLNADANTVAQPLSQILSNWTPTAPTFQAMALVPQENDTNLTALVQNDTAPPPSDFAPQNTAQPPLPQGSVVYLPSGAGEPSGEYQETYTFGQPATNVAQITAPPPEIGSSLAQTNQGDSAKSGSPALVEAGSPTGYTPASVATEERTVVVAPQQDLQYAGSVEHGACLGSAMPQESAYPSTYAWRAAERGWFTECYHAVI